MLSLFKDEKKTKRFRTVMMVITILAGIVLFPNLGRLAELPFKNSLDLDEPVCAVRNDSGCMAIIDSMGSRLILLDSNAEVTCSISYSSLSSVTPSYADGLAMNSDNVFIVDHTMSSRGTTIDGDRVLVYDMDGDYIKTLISSDDMIGEEDEYAYRILNVYTNDENVYATLYDECDDYKVLVADITGGEPKIIHTYSTGEKVCYDVFYIPESDMTCCITYDGTLVIWEGREEILTEEGNLSRFFDDVYAFSDGHILALDTNENKISSYDRNGVRTVIADTSAKNFSINEDMLVYADPGTYTVTSLNIETGEETTVHSFRYNNSNIVKDYAIWAVAILGAVALSALLISVVVPMVKQKINEDDDVLVNKVTIGKLYRTPFITLCLLLGITALIFGKFYYDYAIERNENTVVCAAYGMRQTSALSFGSALEKIDSQLCYGSDAYEEVTSFTKAICMTGVESSSSVNLSCRVYRFLDGTDNIMVVLDPSDESRTGCVITPSEQEDDLILGPIERVKDRKTTAHLVEYNNGTVLYEVYAPVYNADDEVVGAIVPILNETVAASEIKRSMGEVLLEILTLLVGLTVLAIETGYGWTLSKIQRHRHRQKIMDTTVIEAERTVGIAMRIPQCIYYLFCTLIAAQILQESEADSAVLLAMPLTVFGICESATYIFLCPVVHHSPRKYMKLSMLIQVAGLLIAAVAMRKSQITVFIAGSAVFGIGTGLTMATLKILSLCGLERSPEYCEMSSGTVEPIASAIGASIAAVLRSVFGDTALLVFMALMCIVAIPVSGYFIGNDISVSGATRITGQNHQNIMRRMAVSVKGLIRFCLRPAILVVILFGNLLFGILTNFQSVVLPLLNYTSGYSDVMIGFITLLISMFATFAESKVFAATNRSPLPVTIWFAVSCGVIAVLLAIFTIDLTMVTFAAVLIAIEIFDDLLDELADTINYNECKLTGQIPDDTCVALQMFFNVGKNAGPVLITLTMAAGFSGFAGTWLTVCAVSTVISLLILKISPKNQNSM